MSDAIVKHVLDDSIGQFRAMKKLAEKALAQLSDDEFFVNLDAESNSAAQIVKHIAGNLFSRWTDFLTSDGEKDWRNRDTEFIIESGDSRDHLMRRWQDGWQTLFSALEPLTPEDFEKHIMIRAEPHTIVQAINRQLTHYSHHIGQILFVAKHLKSHNWKTLSVPRGKSEEFRQQMLSKFKSQA